MPFGLTNAPASFQCLMNKVFGEQIRDYVLVFFDDILVYSPSMAMHVVHLKTVLELLRKHALFVKRSKCEIAKASVEYLGHVITTEGVKADTEKIRAMVDWPVPKNIKALRGFLGLTGYYRRFVAHYGLISKPLTQLLKKGAFQWSEEAELAFNTLKEAMSTTPVLAMPDFTKPFVLETDACQSGVGAVLMQEGKPIAFLSKVLAARHMSLSTYEKELMAVIMAVQRWRYYLLGHKFIIKTDHEALKYLMEQKLTTLLQHKWLSKLLGYDYSVVYKKGKDNLVADALSRCHDQGAQCNALHTVISLWKQELKNSWETDQFAQEMLVKLMTGNSELKGYKLVDGDLMYEGRWYVGNGNQMRKQIIENVHSSPEGGHSGVTVTARRIQEKFHWPQLKLEVQEYIRACDVCQRCKAEHTSPPGLLQPLPIPNNAWETISLDFIEGLPKSAGKEVILVIVDKLTKYAHFVAISHPYTAVIVAQKVLDTVVKLHGPPKCIISDRDTVFISTFWKELFNTMGTKLNISTAYHPQTDGQTERVNQCLEMYLRCITGQKPHLWSQWLPMAELWYNTCYHTAIGMSPFKALYDQEPPPIQYQSAGVSNPGVKQFVKDRVHIQQLLKENLLKAQERMQWYANKHRVDRQFNVGDEVFLKLQPYRQASVVLRRNQKLSAKFYGPYKISRRVGNVAYRVELPAGSKVHNVFHVSQLKKRVGKGKVIQTELPGVNDEGELQIEPVAVLDRQLVKKGNRPATRVLIQWTNGGRDEATWELWEDIHKKFPKFDPWGQGSV
ncbi:hypothetical protein DCAR_0415120 [Daucus carota subsp. sativus]|uniref:Integrase catalytic domain-containing protein n=1 Tax=Daucus carota subsp. sativus TaxID=79200 RepID=A0AAF1AWJ6_DAUCS|nr:hypothetical protein DCAR_0415120 [Daucus carota subsp. sativus]